MDKSPFVHPLWFYLHAPLSFFFSCRFPKEQSSDQRTPGRTLILFKTLITKSSRTKWSRGPLLTLAHAEADSDICCYLKLLRLWEVIKDDRAWHLPKCSDFLSTFARKADPRRITKQITECKVGPPSLGALERVNDGDISAIKVFRRFCPFCSIYGALRLRVCRGILDILGRSIRNGLLERDVL